MCFHAGQCGHHRLHYHVVWHWQVLARGRAWWRRRHLHLCHEAVAAQGLLGRCCWKIWDSRLPPCPNHHFLFSLIVIWNFNHVTGCLWFPHLWKNCWLFYAEKALDLTRIEMSSTWGEGALEKVTYFSNLPTLLLRQKSFKLISRWIQGFWKILRDMERRSKGPWWRFLGSSVFTWPLKEAAYRMGGNICKPYYLIRG